MKKIGILLVVALIPIISEAGYDFYVPEGYDYGMSDRGDLVELVDKLNTKEVNYLTYMVASKNRDIAKENKWLVECSRQLIEGIPEAYCKITNMPKAKFAVVINSASASFPNMIVFDSDILEKIQKGILNKNAMNLEVKYKIDSTNTLSSPVVGIAPSYSANMLVNRAKAGDTLYYSIKKNNKFESYTINLKGFKEAVNFANSFIYLNK